MTQAGQTRAILTSLSHLRDRRIRRIMTLAGLRPRLGRPRDGDVIAVWGHRPTAARGERLASETGAQIIRMEDAFLRSLHPGRMGEPPIGLALDRRGIYYDARNPSDLEELLATHPLDDTALLNRARAGIAFLRNHELSKYAAFDPDLAPPPPGYVLVIDQTRGDASVEFGNANDISFAEMLTEARLDHPNTPIFIKGHPETAQNIRPGYFDPTEYGTGTELPQITYMTDSISPWRLLDGAIAVYTVTSQLGFEAILAGHRPRVYGHPFYAGWGLTDDKVQPPRRRRNLTRAQLFAATMLLYPKWYDPFTDTLCEFERAAQILAAEARAWREDHKGVNATGIRRWKRPHLRRFFTKGRVRFAGPPQPNARTVNWGTDTAVGTTRIEDGFIRSRGLGARLVPPVSLILDNRGIYYDPARPSDLEHYVTEAAKPSQDQTRAEALHRMLLKTGITKYNLPGLSAPDLPQDRRILLVVGQVEDDASIRYGADTIRNNMELLKAARAANPDAFIVYKPHPDIEARLRPGSVPEADLSNLADLVANDTDPAALLVRTDALWTITSLMGFEALLRDIPVTCVGRPFYAGWGLTMDLPTRFDAALGERRRARPSVTALVDAALIRYPRYIDPMTGKPCPVEVVVERLAQGQLPQPPLANRALALLQDVFAGQSWIWR